MFLDEPTSGLDPESAKLVRDFIASLKSEGRTIFLCTHNLDEADRLCDRVAIFKRRVIRLDTPGGLRKSLFGHAVEFRLRGSGEKFAAVARLFDFVKDVAASDGQLRVNLDDPDQATPVLVKALVDAGAELLGVQEAQHSLEDVYVSLMQENR